MPDRGGVSRADPWEGGGRKEEGDLSERLIMPGRPGRPEEEGGGGGGGAEGQRGRERRGEKRKIKRDLFSCGCWRASHRSRKIIGSRRVAAIKSRARARARDSTSIRGKLCNRDTGRAMRRSGTVTVGNLSRFKGEHSPVTKRSSARRRNLAEIVRSAGGIVSAAEADRLRLLSKVAARLYVSIRQFSRDGRTNLSKAEDRSVAPLALIFARSKRKSSAARYFRDSPAFG